MNGTIAATGRTFSLEGTPNVENFELMVPESAFRPGANTLGSSRSCPAAVPALRPL